MSSSLRLIGFGIVVMFTALFLSASYIQVFAREEIAKDDRNVRKLYESFSAERGEILADGTPIARSIPVDNQYQFLRSYPFAEIYAPVIGYYTLNQGNAGIEREMNSALTGGASSNLFDRIANVLTGSAPQGASVQLTLDPDLQKVAFDALGDRDGAVVALDPKTGKVLAMVSKPTFNPNNLAAHSTSIVLDAYKKLSENPKNPLANRAIAGDQYFPGSVFKILITAAALQSGDYTATSSLPNPAQLKLPLSENLVENSGGLPCGPAETVTLEDAFKLSCNIQYAELGLDLGETRIGSLADDFGFGATLEIPLKVTPSNFPRGLDSAQLMLSSFGQFDVRVTPLQVAMLSAGVANDGVLMKPYLVDSLIAPDLEIIESYEPTVYSRPLDVEVSREMKRLMTRNVGQGVASGAGIDNVSVAGKTGTAETGIGDGRSFWFTGFAPADSAEIVVAVVVEGARADGSSNKIAAPIAKKILEAGVTK